MPFKSDAQRRFMFAAQDRGEIPKGTAERWARETPNIKSLPERVKTHKKTAAEVAGGVLEKIALSESLMRTIFNRATENRGLSEVVKKAPRLNRLMAVSKRYTPGPWTEAGFAMGRDPRASSWLRGINEIIARPEEVSVLAKGLPHDPYTHAPIDAEILKKFSELKDRSKEIGGFQSKAQQRFMFAAEARGDLPKGKAREWARDTPNIKQLPDKVKKTASELADAALAVTPFTGALQDFYEGGKSAPGGIMYEGPFKIANQVPVAQRETGSLAQLVLTKIGYTLTPEQYAMLSPTAQDYDTGGHVGRMLGAPVGLGLGLKYMKEPKSALFRALLGLGLGSLGGGILGSGIGAGVGAWKERNSPEFPDYPVSME